LLRASAGGGWVLISPLLKGQVFDPEALATRNAVFADVCARLGLTDKADPVTRLVAEKIVDLASREEYDREGLRQVAYLLFEIEA
jgi:hypothetical protein